MKRTLLLAISCIFVNSLHAQETSSSQDPWVMYMTPSPFHKMLSSYAGEWKMDVTMWMEENTAPMKTSMKSSHAMISNGLFLEMNQVGDMMGMPFTARISIGYNNSSKEVELNSYTNMGSGMTFLHGSWDAAKKAASLKGTMTDPVSGKAINVRQVLSFPDANTLVIENYDQVGPGKEHKTMEFRCSRT